MNSSDEDANRISVIIFPFSHPVAKEFSKDVVRIFEGQSFHSDIYGPPIGLDNVSSVEYHSSALETPMRPGGSVSLLWFCRYLVAMLTIQAEMFMFVWRRLRKSQCFFFYLGPFFAAQELLCRAFGKRVVILHSGSDVLLSEQVFGPWLSRIVGLLARIAVAFADMVVVESERIRRDMIQSTGLRTIIVGSARFVDLEVFNSSLLPSLREPVIGYVGRFSPEKGISRVFPALERLITSCPQVRLMLVGSGPEDPRISSLVERLPSGRVEMYGWRERNLLPSLYGQMRVLLVPSLSEGLPTTVLEAMACGTPVVSTRVGGLQDLVVPGETGFLLADTSFEEVVRVVACALDSEGLDRMSKAGRKLIENSYSLESARSRLAGVVNYAVRNL